MKPGPVLVVPSAAKGRGGGHLVRSIHLLRSLRSSGREAWIFLPASVPPAMLDSLPEDWIIREEAALAGRSWDWIILDNFRTSSEDFRRYRSQAPLIGIDEGGPERDRFEFLLDLLPGPPGRSAPNLCAPAFLPGPRNRRKEPFAAPEDRPLRILVSFGAEDPRSLALLAVRALLPPPEGFAPGVEITLVEGGLGGSAAEALGQERWVRLLKNVPELREKLAGFDLVVTHFGLTAFESIRAGTPALLLSPTAYHEKLAQYGGFLSAGIRDRGIRRLRKLVYPYPALQALEERRRDLAARYGLDGPEAPDLGALLAKAPPSIARSCPVCEADAPAPVLARFPDRTYRRCPRCGMVYMLRLSPPPIEYETAYFFEFYKKQYGKTYLEDFPNLKRMGTARLEKIKKILPKGMGGARSPVLLDLGCAYGPFLAAAAEAGFSPIGQDPAEDAVRYVREKLKIPAFRGFFPEPLPAEANPGGRFAVITLWYVIEHFGNPGQALREIHRWLEPGGVLAFSTPSCAGISARKSRQLFLERSPGDHWTIWDPRRVSGILRRFGFKVKKTAVTGHHPERFPWFEGRLFYPLMMFLSRIFRLGDTFEVYAVKL